MRPWWSRWCWRGNRIDSGFLAFSLRPRGSRVERKKHPPRLAVSVSGAQDPTMAEPRKSRGRGASAPDTRGGAVRMARGLRVDGRGVGCIGLVHHRGTLRGWTALRIRPRVCWPPFSPRWGCPSRWRSRATRGAWKWPCAAEDVRSFPSSSWSTTRPRPAVTAPSRPSKSAGMRSAIARRVCLRTAWASSSAASTAASWRGTQGGARSSAKGFCVRW